MENIKKEIQDLKKLMHDAAMPVQTEAFQKAAFKHHPYMKDGTVFVKKWLFSKLDCGDIRLSRKFRKTYKAIQGKFLHDNPDELPFIVVPGTYYELHAINIVYENIYKCDHSNKKIDRVDHSYFKYDSELNRENSVDHFYVHHPPTNTNITKFIKEYRKKWIDKMQSVRTVEVKYDEFNLDGIALNS